MRGLRSFLGLLAVLVALGAYLYFVESKRTPGDDAEKREKVFAVEGETIEEVTIRAEAGDQTTLRKSGEEWQIVSPTNAPADEAEISGITSNLSNLEEQRLIEENAANLEEFGLARPRIEVAFKAGGEEQRLLIGSKTPTGSDLYAKTAARPRVFLIAAYLESTFNRSGFDLRDKRALRFERDTAEALEITTAGGPVTFTMTDGEWRIAKPPVERADAAAIEGLLARIHSLQMKSVETAEPQSSAKFGLDHPAATVKIRSGSSEATLMLGGEAGEGNIYARTAAQPTIFTVESAILEDLRKDVSEYRQKDLFDARAFNTTRVEIARGGQSRVFEKATGDAGGWRQTAPDAKELDTEKVQALLSALTVARASAFEPAPAGAKTEAAFTLTFDEGRQEQVTFLRAGEKAYAIREGAAAAIEASVLDAIVKALGDL